MFSTHHASFQFSFSYFLNILDFFLLYSLHLSLLNLTIKITDRQVKFEFQVNDTFLIYLKYCREYT